LYEEHKTPKTFKDHYSIPKKGISLTSYHGLNLAAGIGIGIKSETSNISLG